MSDFDSYEVLQNDEFSDVNRIICKVSNRMLDSIIYSVLYIQNPYQDIQKGKPWLPGDILKLIDIKHTSYCSYKLILIPFYVEGYS